MKRILPQLTTSTGASQLNTVHARSLLRYGGFFLSLLSTLVALPAMAKQGNLRISSQSSVSSSAPMPVADTSLAAIPSFILTSGTPKSIDPYRASVAAPYVRLGAVHSTDGETLQRFVMRAAMAADSFTRATGQEACGVIMRSVTEPVQYFLELTTNRAQVRCVMIEFPKEAFVRLGPTLHTHPAASAPVGANAVDAALRPREFFCGKRIRILWQDFSEGDLRHGQGYLVSGGRVLYQRGKDHPFQLVGYYSPSATPSALYFGEPYASARASHAAAAWQKREHAPLPAVSCPPAGPAATEAAPPVITSAP